MVGEFLDDSKEATDEELLFSISEPPSPTGSDSADSLVAALAEYLCVHRDIVPPSWTQAPSEVRPWWFAAGPRFAAIAMRESPMSFARRGIFITRGALERA